jgi:hypothetical protein
MALLVWFRHHSRRQSKELRALVESERVQRAQAMDSVKQAALQKVGEAEQRYRLLTERLANETEAERRALTLKLDALERSTHRRLVDAQQRNDVQLERTFDLETRIDRLGHRRGRGGGDGRSRQQRVLHTFSFSDKYYTYLCEMLQSGAGRGYNVTLLGWQAPYRSLFDKIDWMARAVVKDEEHVRDTDLVLFVDAHDVLFVGGTADELMHAFDRLAAGASADAVFSAEKTCWPQVQTRGATFCDTAYPPVPEHHARALLDKYDDEPLYRYLNSGAWMATGVGARRVLRAALLERERLKMNGRPPPTNDQEVLSDLFAFGKLNGRGEGSAAATTTLDYGHELFFPLDKARHRNRALDEWHDDLAFGIDSNDGVFVARNRRVGSTPFVLHFNGNAKTHQPRVNKALLGPPHRRFRMATVPAFGANFEPLLFPKLTVRDVCCTNVEHMRDHRRSPSWCSAQSAD